MHTGLMEAGGNNGSISSLVHENLEAREQADSGEIIFQPKWFARVGIKHEVIIKIADARKNFDPNFLPDLKESLRKGYNYALKLAVTSSDDPELQGWLVNGKHRCYEMDELLTEGVALPSPFPIEYIHVKSMGEIYQLRLKYEEEWLEHRNIHKSTASAKESMKDTMLDMEGYLLKTSTMPLEQYIDASTHLSDKQKEWAKQVWKDVEKKRKLHPAQTRLESSTSDKKDWGKIALTNPLNAAQIPGAIASGSGAIKCPHGDEMTVHFIISKDERNEFWVLRYHVPPTRAHTKGVTDKIHLEPVPQVDKGE